MKREDNENKSGKQKKKEKLCQNFINFFSHKQCEYFPCHKTDDPDNFNCLFCFCPLYLKGAECGGNFRYTEKGVKDCSQCMFPHERKNYTKMMEKLRQK
ncbi:MAG: cysteine-rich small domain-containing protein [Faecalimonas umbilicata]